MLLYTARSEISTLMPNACDAFWTDLSRVFSDDVPQPAGVGALQIAQQALNLSTADAATLVANAGATNLSGAALRGFAGPAASQVIPNPRGVNGVRLPIPSNVATQSPLLGGDPSRSFMLIQNNNATGGATLLVSVDGPINTATPAFYMNFPPQQGLLLDEEILINPIYVAWTTGAIAGAVIFYGSGPPNPAQQPQAGASGPRLSPYH